MVTGIIMLVRQRAVGHPRLFSLHLDLNARPAGKVSRRHDFSMTIGLKGTAFQARFCDYTGVTVREGNL